MLPGIRRGADSFEKRTLVTVDGVGTVTDIQRASLRRGAPVELIIAGNYGARTFDRSYKQTAAIDFAIAKPYPKIPARIVKVPGGGVFFFSKAQSWAGSDRFLDTSGRETFRLPYNSIASNFGYLRDRSPEFLFADKDRIQARDPSGNLLWQNNDVGWTFELGLLEAGPDGGPVALAIDGGKLLGLGQNGTLLFARKPPVNGYFSDFGIFRWPTICNGECLLVMRDDGAVILSSEGQSVVQRLGPGHYIQSAHGQAVRFYRDQPPMLAVAGFLLWKQPSAMVVHGVLFIFDHRGELIYHEVFPEKIDALYASPAKDGNTETLLVGAANTVLQYSVSNGTLPNR